MGSILSLVDSSLSHSGALHPRSSFVCFQPWTGLSSVSAESELLRKGMEET